MRFHFGMQKQQQRPAAPGPEQKLGLRIEPQFRAAVQQDTLELMIYGEIVDQATISMLEAWGYSSDGLISAVNVKKALDTAGDVARIRVRINSPGGDAFEGIAIHALLTSQDLPVETLVDGIAASSASIVAMAGSVRKMGRSAMMMIHDAWTGCVGNARDMRKMADTLDKIDGSIGQAYIARTGLDAAAVQSLMDEETWMSAQECVERGFATAVIEQSTDEEEAAQALAQRFKSRVRSRRDAPPPPPKAAADDTECECSCESCVDGHCEECSNTECTDPNCKDCPMQSESAESNLSLYAARWAVLQHGIRSA